MSSSKLTGLDIKMLARIIEFEARLARAGLHFRVVSGFRSLSAQARIYAQGRTAHGKIVTYAEPGQSYHNFGLAVDYVWVPDRGRSKVVDWEKFGKIVRSCNLVWGGDWKKLRDLGHVQYPGRLPKRSGAK